MPKCKATAEILVKSHNNSAFSAESEIVIMQSEPIIQLVIDKLKLETVQKNPLNTKEFKDNLNIEYNQKNNKVLVSYRHSDPLIAKEIIDALLEVYL